MKIYRKSEQHLERAERVIPMGSQTFSKSRAFYPHGVSPYFITHGERGHVWDLDGNEYIDLVSGLATVNLGYADEDVTKAVTEQLRRGVIFTLPHPLEAEVAELLVETIPCAEMVRFAKNGSDATAGAIRLARAYTNRDHVAVCGYHGWQDWYIGSTHRNRGVPQATRDLTHPFTYNDVESLQRLFRQYPKQIAAVILEPMSRTEPQSGYLQAVQALTHDEGALLIFDEMISGFRFAIGGAQERFGVIPDLATFGKGIANGFPLSAIVGRERVMSVMEEIFFSLTYGGEALSLAAAAAVIRKIKTEPVIPTMADTGRRLQAGVGARLDKYGMDHVMTVCGDPTWFGLVFKSSAEYSEWEIQTFFMQEILARGVLSYGGLHIVNYAHSQDDIDRVLQIYDEVMPLVREAVDNRSLRNRLRCSPLQPLFKVR
jgi:glutamate-1-semialdehyde 2,1-aminomutase